MVIYKEIRGTVVSKGVLDVQLPPTQRSRNWKHWVAVLDIKTCAQCVSNHGQIYGINAFVSPEPPIHDFCRCSIETMKSVVAGKGTKDGENGADWQLKYNQTTTLQNESLHRWGGDMARLRQSMHLKNGNNGHIQKL